MYKFHGTIIKVSPVITVTGKFKEKCTFVVRDDKGDREIAFLLFDAQIDQFLKPLELGDYVEVTFTVKSREYQGSYTTNCFAINIDLMKRGKTTSDYGSKKKAKEEEEPLHRYDTRESYEDYKRKQQEQQRKQREEKERENERKREEQRRREEQNRKSRQSGYDNPFGGGGKGSFEDFFEQFRQNAGRGTTSNGSNTYHDYFAGINNKDEAKKRYRKLAMEYHPDKNPGNKEAEEKMKQVNLQYARWS